MNEVGRNAMIAMVGITLIVLTALSMGQDGVFLMTGIALLSGLGGYPILQEVKTKLGNMQGLPSVVRTTRKVKR